MPAPTAPPLAPVEPGPGEIVLSTREIEPCGFGPGTGKTELGASRPEFGAGELELELDPETPAEELVSAPIAPAAPPVIEETSDAQSEVTGFYDGFDAGAGFATTKEIPYEGLALLARNLFLPLEELLHDRTGGEGGVSLRTRGTEEVCDRFASELVPLAQSQRCLPLTVRSDALLCEGRPVLREARHSGAGLYRLHAAGVQTLSIVEGIDRQQAHALARVLSQPATEGASLAETEGDVARWFWELGLTHVRLAVLETFEEVEPLPETGLPTLEVPDQAVEQMIRLRSRLLATAAGSSGASGKARVLTVPTLVIGADELRALERDLYGLAGPLLSAPARTRTVLPYPALPPLEAETRQGLEADLGQIEARQIDGLLQTALGLLDPQRAAAVIERLAARPGAFFGAGEPEKAERFLRGLRAWAAQEPGAREKGELVDAIHERASAPGVLLPLFECCHTAAAAEKAVRLLELMPASATATLGMAVARKDAPARLLACFSERLAEHLEQLAEQFESLEPEQAAGLLDGAVAVRSPGAAQLAPLLAGHEATAARQAAARACAALPVAAARGLLQKLINDEEAPVRRAAVAAILAHREPAQLAPVLEEALGAARGHEWCFDEKRAAMRALAQVRGSEAKGLLRQMAEHPNPYRRRSLSEQRAAAALALALLRDPADEKLALSMARDADRRVVAEAATALLQTLRGPGIEAAALIARTEKQFSRFDGGEGEEEAPEEKEAAVRELSPHALKAMRIDDLLAAPGDKVQSLGVALASGFAHALELGTSGRVSTEAFTVSIGRATNAAGALAELLDGSVGLQTFGDHFFVNARRLRLPFASFQALAPLREAFAKLRIGEMQLAEAPSKSDLIEALYAMVTALKVEREPWTALERNFARVRLRELSLIKESWGRVAEIGVDVRANAARLLGTLYLWFDDAAHLPDGHDLLPLRAERLVRELTDAAAEQEALLEGLLGPKAHDADAALYAAHCVLLSAAFGRWLGCRRDQISSLVRCAMHRHLGLLALPRPLLEDLGAENEIEAGELARSSLYSAARIAAAENAGQSLALPAVAAFETLAPISAVGARGQRYLRPQAPLTHGRILAIAERYVFLTTSFPRRPASSADDALTRMLDDPELDGRLVQAFANGAAIIPAGARVRLSDGREALVVSAPLHLSSAEPLVLKVALDCYGAPAADMLLGAPTLVLTGEDELAPQVTGVLEAPAALVDWQEMASLLL